MTRIAFCADCHLGNHRRFGGPVEASLNRRCREGLEVLRAAADRAVATRAFAFVVLGDLFDYQRPEPSLLAAVQHIFADLDDRLQGGVILLVGNHDQTSSTTEDNALSPLFPHATVVEHPQAVNIGGVELILIPFRPGHEKAEDWLPTVLDQMPPAGTKARVLGLHLGIADEQTAVWLRDSRDAIKASTLIKLGKEHGVSAVFAGNWHDRRIWKRSEPTVFQLGALVPTGWDNPGLQGYGTLAFWDDGKIDFEELTGPRFLKLKAGQNPPKHAHQFKTYVSITAAQDEVLETQSWLDSGKVTGTVVDGEVLIDTADSKVAARSAATAARSAETLDEAVSGFVEDMPLEDGVARFDVLALSRGYLIGAS